MNSESVGLQWGLGLNTDARFPQVTLVCGQIH